MNGRRSVCIRPGIVHRAVDDEIVLLDPATSEYFSINGSGALLWIVLADTNGADERTLCSRLQEHYGIGQADADRDVVAFVDSLVGAGLLAVTEG